jgi:ribonuclease R
MVHRVIKAILGKRRFHLVANAKTRTPEVRKWGKGGKAQGKAPRPMTAEMALWEAAGGHCSANERRADEASRDVEAWLKCRYMREHLGEEFSGTVSAVAGFGLFVTLDALYVDGMVHITELGGEYYRFDEARGELRGERTGIRYAVGTRVRVQVSRVDLDGRKIDFRMVREGEGDKLPARTERSRPVAAGGVGAVAELAQVRESDRLVKAATRAVKAKGVPESARRSRKPGPQRPAPKPRTRR